jgi:peptidoglycan/LPS O-acetylase OafA/YrhL
LTPPAAPKLDESTSSGLDLLRGFLAVLVLFSHAFRQTVTRSEWATSDTLLIRVLHASVGQGLVWVMGFFVISGLCIQMSIRRSLETGTWSFSDYLRARFSRIYPLFLVGIAACLLAEWLNPRPDQFSWDKVAGYFFMLQGFTGYTDHFAPSWSLTNECLYYLAWPVILVACRFHSARAWWAGVALTLLVTGGLVFWWLAEGKPHGPLNESWTVTVRFLVWLVGVGLYERWTAMTGSRNSGSAGNWLFAAAALAFLTLYTAFWMYSRRVFLLHGLELVAGIGFAFLIIRLRDAAWLREARWKKLAHTLGIWSYPLYLLHQPVIGLTDLLFKPGAMLAGSPVWISGPVFIAAPLIVCWLLGAPLERRILSWRKSWLKAPTTPKSPL